MKWIIDYNISAAVLTFIILIVYFMRDRFGDRAGKLFVALTNAILVASIFDIITGYYNSYSNLVQLSLNYFLNIVYGVSYISIPLLGYLYVLEMVKDWRKCKLNKFLALISFILQVLLIFSSPYTHWITYFEDGVYKHGPLYGIHAVISVSFIIASFVTIFINRRKINKLKKFAVYLFTILAIFSIIFQLLRPQVLVVNFLASLFIMIIYIALQDPENYIDKGSECLNKKAFFKIFTEKLQTGDDGAVVFLEFECFSYINRMIGVETANEMLVKVADFLRRGFGKKNVFHLSYGKFAVLFKNQQDAMNAAERITFYYEREEMAEKLKVSWTPKMCMIEYPKIASSLEDMMDISTYFFEESLGGNYKEIIIVDEDLLIGKKRKNAVLQAIVKAIKMNSFQVYFQPIIDTKSEKVKSAEALVRLVDEKLGFISPDEFILIAEENGCIIEIDRIVLEKVCQFLKKENLSRFGITYVEVNLSVVELMQENFAEEIFRIMDFHGIPHSQISFEITETAYMNTESTFSKNIKKIIQNGASISMDDYGTGFSNTGNLIKFPYKLVKIDKSILWESMKQKSAHIFLENTVLLLKKIYREIVVEGVETREQVELLQKLEVDKLQGYYYSRPLPMDEFIEFLERNSKERDTDEL